MAWAITAVCTNGGSVSGGGTYEDGARFTLSATASDGYRFFKWVRDRNSAHMSWSMTYSQTASKNETYRAIFVKIVAEHGTVSPRNESSYTVGADAGYVFQSLSATSGGSYLTISGSTVTVSNTAPSGADLVVSANIRRKAASDNYNVYLRWKSTYSTSQGGQEFTRLFRVVKGSSSGSTQLRVFGSASTAQLSDAAPNSGVAVSRSSVTSGGSTWYAANYFPLADGGDYWVGRNVGAMRNASVGKQLVGWVLKGKSDGAQIGEILPADGTTTINAIATALDNAGDGEAPFSNNSSGDYHVAFLEAEWGMPRTVEVSFTGANDETPSVSATPSPAFADKTVTLTAQTTGLSTCQFSSWTVTSAGGVSVPVTVVSAGVATFAMPDSNVTAVATYAPKKFTVSASSGSNGHVEAKWKAPSDTNWRDIPQGGVNYGSLVKLTAIPEGGYVFDGWYKTGESSKYSVISPYEVESLSDDIVLTAQFVLESVPQTATLAVVSNDAAKGTVDILGGDGHQRESDGSGATAGFDIGDDVTLVAEISSSEYAFAGWFAGDVKISDDLVHKFKFGNDAEHSLVSYRAVFGESDDAIYEWEGSTENKTMEWQSKVYTAPKPFDPVAARVDATSYAPPVSLDVGTMSSPDAEPMRAHAISVGSQDGRRLPRMRPERFVRFTVESAHEIDAVVIGTNMAEVN